MCSGRVRRSCSISSTCCVTVKRHEYMEIVFDTSIRKYVQIEKDLIIEIKSTYQIY